MMDHYPYYLNMKERLFSMSVSTILVIAVAYLTCLDLNHSSYLLTLKVGSGLFVFSHLVALVMGGLMGSAMTMTYILLVFTDSVFTNITDAYLVAIILLMCLLSEGVAHWRLLDNWRGILGTFLVFSMLLGNIWFYSVNYLSLADAMEWSLQNALQCTVAVMPEVALYILICWLYYYRAPNGMKRIFCMSNLYSKEYLEKGKAPVSVLRLRVSVAMGIALIVIIFFSVVIGWRLYTALSLETLQNSESSEVGRYISEGILGFGDSMGTFNIKLVMMIVTIVVPLLDFFMTFMQREVVTPVQKLSNYMTYYAHATDENRQQVAWEIHDLKPRRNGEVLELYNSLHLLVDELTWYIAKIQEEKSLEDELRVAQAASAAKTNFLSHMSHEIRTPINAVLGMDELILRESREENTLQYAYNIRNAGNTLLSLINDVLDFSKIEAGKMELLEENYDISSTINDLVVMTDTRAKKKQLEFEAIVNPEIPQVLLGDETRVKQCALNLLTNAVKYTEEGKVTLRIGFEKVDEDYILLMVSVKDTGMGIAEEDIEALFAPFERINSEKNKSIEGTGLGMSIVIRLLEEMGSELKVESEKDVGSEFSFAVKQRVIDWEPLGDYTKSLTLSDMHLESFRESFHAPDAYVLVVDDTEMNLIVFRGLLKNTRMHIDMVMSGQEALIRVKQRVYDMVFIDHRMPDMDGIDTIRAIKNLPDEYAENRSVPCIALTANVISGAQEMYLDEGFVAYMSKPVNGEKLESLIMSLLPEEKYQIVMEPLGIAEKDGSRWDVIDEAENFDVVVEGLDMEAAIANCGGAQVLYSAMENFVLGMEEKLRLIRRYVNEENWKEYTVQVHAAKSSTRLLGAMEVSTLAGYLEKCGNEERVGEIKEKTPDFLDIYRDLGDKISNALSQAKGDLEQEKESISEKQLKEALQSLEELVMAFDFDGADMIVERLAEYRLPPGFEDVFARIKQLLGAVDQDGLLALLGDVRNEG